MQAKSFDDWLKDLTTGGAGAENPHRLWARNDMNLPAFNERSRLIQPQMMVQERYFYDPVAGNYTVRPHLDDRRKIWRIGCRSYLAGYPNMGIDNRNSTTDPLHCP